jgi:hypothetical protein
MFKSGNHATWESLEISFSFERKNVLRILVTSQQTEIGYCNVSRTKILSGKVGKKGFLTVRYFVSLFYSFLKIVNKRYFQTLKRPLEKLQENLK